MKKAFSLIELVLSLLIVSILALVLSNIFSFNLGFLKNTQAKEREYKDLCTSMMYIENTIRGADKIDPSYFESKAYARKNIPMGELTEGKDKKVFNFHVENNKLYIRRRNEETIRYGLSPNAIANISSLDFSLDASLLTIRLVSENGTYELTTMLDLGGKL